MPSLTPPVSVLVEGIIDEAIARRILAHVSLLCGTVYGKRGKDYLLECLPAYNRAARFIPWLVVVDLDHDAPCAPDFVQDRLPVPASGMCLRLAVRAAEAWLLADAERLAGFLSVPLAKIPTNPDVVPNPKAALVDLARQSRSRAIRDDMVPRPNSGGRVGPGYTGRIIEFVSAPPHQWRPDVAAGRSDSLRRCLEALTTLKTWKPD